MESTSLSLCAALYLYLLIVFSTAKSEDDNMIVKISTGLVRGSMMTSKNMKKIYAFRGIPYAKPPVRELRFKPPEEPNKWEDIYDADEDGHVCIQHDLLQNLYKGDEDCLYLNVYTQQLAQTSLKPVMVFIHGGAFVCGEASSTLYGPNKLVDNDIVLVTLNYRLAVLGFLSTEDSASPGNYGLLDQVQALRWVQNNIAHFGGDPNSVTIFGESAGGASVVYQVISGLAEGLFHAAISQSGSAISTWALHSNPLENGKALAEIMQCPTETTTEMVECLRKRAALDIVRESSMLQIGKSNFGKSIRFGPVNDANYGGTIQFLTDHPQSMLENNNFNNVPNMIGVDQDEGYIFMTFLQAQYGSLYNFTKDTFVSYLKGPSSPNPDYTMTITNPEELAQRYLDDIDDSNDTQRIKALSNLFGDIFINADADKTVEILAANGVPVYTYKFTHKSQQSMTSLFPSISPIDIDKMNIVAHGDELPYLFSSEIFTDNKFNEADRKMEEILLKLWTNFAKTKVPTVDGLDNMDTSFKWNSVKTGRTQHANLNLSYRMVDGPLCTKPELWKRIPNNIREDL